MKLIRHFICLTLSALLSPLLNAQTIELAAPASAQIVYQPFSGLSAAESVELELSSIKDINPELQGNGQGSVSDTYYNIRIRPSDGGRFVARSAIGGKLPLMIGSASPQKLAQFDNQYLHHIRFSDRKSERRTLNYSLGISESIWAAPGRYKLPLEFEVVSATDKDNVLLSKTMLLEVIVEPNLQTNLAGQIGSFEDGVDVAIVDFGTLETNETKQIYIQVRGNAPARISLSSENKGFMVNSKNKKWVVDYDIEVDGVTSTLETTLELERPVAKNFRGSAYPMQITVGDVSKSFSGKYTDVISIDVSPQ